MSALHQTPRLAHKLQGMFGLTTHKSVLYYLYLISISIVGLVLVGWGVWQFLASNQYLLWLLLIVLAAFNARSSAYVSISENAGVAYHTGAVVSLAALPALGLPAGMVIAGVENVISWLNISSDKPTWKRSPIHLIFNVGMVCIALFCAGWLLLWMRNWFGADTLLGATLPWFVAATVFNEVNLLLLIGILRLEQGPSVQSWSLWLEDHRWASQISTLVLMLGSGILAFAIQRFDELGVIIFYLPTFLSAYAFQLYVRGMQAEMKKLEKKVEERTHDLAELNRQKDAFLAVLTHDMMTPLTSIQLCAEELVDDPMAAATNPYLAKVMVRSQKTLFNLVRNILDLEKLRSGRPIALQKTVNDLRQITDGVIEIVQPEAQAKQISLSIECKEQPFLLEVDRQQMERILLNLVSNAVKYTPSGGSVCVLLGHESGQAKIAVTDTGYGIPPEELPYIFERFRRVEQLKDKAVGTGLGLAITKALIEEHDGQITVESTVGQGSTFTVMMPL